MVFRLYEKEEKYHQRYPHDIFLMPSALHYLGQPEPERHHGQENPVAVLLQTQESLWHLRTTFQFLQMLISQAGSSQIRYGKMTVPVTQSTHG